jgi:GAF domain-containing protein
MDEAQQYTRIEQNFVRAGVSSLIGRYSLSDFNWVGPAFRMGGSVVVPDVQTTPLIPDADRSAVTATGVGAFVAAPLIRDGRLVAALCVSDVSPRAWAQRSRTHQGNRRADLGAIERAVPRAAEEAVRKDNSWRCWRMN